MWRDIEVQCLPRCLILKEFDNYGISRLQIQEPR